MTLRSLAWVLAFALIVVLAIPWFLWGSSRVIAGLPIWLWWHVGWMVLTAIVFRSFTRRAWGLGITGGHPDADDTDASGGGRR